MKVTSLPDVFSALIGIDWADKKHDVCEFAKGSEQPTYSVICSSPKAILEWANHLKEKYSGKQVAVACELKKGPLTYALEQYDHIVIFPINPISVANFRKAFTYSGAKNDPSDARLQAEILKTQMHKLSPLFPDSPAIRALSQLTEYRRGVVQSRVDLTNKITSLLKNYYPQVLQWFHDKDTVIFCEFVTRLPTIQAAKKTHRSTLTKFFNDYNSRYLATNNKRLDEIKSSTPLTSDKGVIEPNQLLVELLIGQLKHLISGIEKLDHEIKTRYKAQKDRAIFDSFPGAGPQLAPRLLAAFGTNRDRYSNASELQMYTGIAPVVERSGQKVWTHWRYSCPKFLRQTFVEWAGLSIRYSFWANAYYRQQIAKGKPHNAAVRALAFKWIRIAFRCWKSGTPYDESKYLEALKKRGSPLLEYATKI